MHGAGNSADYRLMRADGSPLPLDEHPSRRALVEGDVAPHDVIVPLEDGRRRVVSVRATALPEGTEAVDGRAALLVYRDVTSERAESRRLAEFAEVTAHDLRSPLTTVRGWVSLASQELSGDAPSVAAATRPARQGADGRHPARRPARRDARPGPRARAASSTWSRS